MIRKNFNRDWRIIKGSNSSMLSMLMGGGDMSTIQLPHDAMIHEKVTPDTKNGSQTGFYPGAEYVYLKKLYVPKEWLEKTVIVEFEGVYRTAMVYVNGHFAKKNLCGYSNFYVTLDPFLRYGTENEIKVIADNAAELNSRWYSGSGIYRDVKLLTGERNHIPADGVRITTLNANEEYATVEIQTEIKNLLRTKEKIKVKTMFLYEGETAAEDILPVTMFPQGEETVRQSVCVMKPKLWDCEHPDLYECKVQILSGETVLDEVSEKTGIRMFSLDAEHGLKINGKEVKLRGTCIHHDNGIIGAATLAAAEERRCRQIKEAGFNSIRSAHHPMSKAMLSACDKYGVLVMDELSDMWTYHKNPQDLALDFADIWSDLVERMVKKDYNHPSVLMYSSGNEIPELGLDSGAKMNRDICNRFHELDPSRYTTTGINGMMAVSFSCGLDKILSDLIDDYRVDDSADNAGGGANAFNSYMSIMEGEGADNFSRHPLLTEAIEESALAADITGLNYLTARHVLEKELHPNKTVVGTETYPADIVRLWKIVKENPHMLGDFTWTGYDYLGEAGCGIFHYDGSANFSSIFPERAAYIGDINLIGYRRPVSYLREIVFGLRKDPYIAVERVNKYGMECSKSAWMLKDNVASWTWNGYEGRPAIVDVYSDAEEVELFLNGNSMGRRPAGEENDYTATYELTYEPGELAAVSYKNGHESGRQVLYTADSEVEMFIDADKTELKADGEDLAFLTVKLVDKKGKENLWERKEIQISLEGAGIIQGFGSADPSTTGGYNDLKWNTYDGYVMAVVRSNTEAGEIRVTFSADGLEDKSVVIVSH